MRTQSNVQRHKCPSGLVGLLPNGFLVLLALSAAANAQLVSPFIPQSDRIFGTIGGQTVLLKGNLNPLARPANDQGPVDPSLDIPGMELTFSRTDAQEADLQQLLLDQQDPASANYHKWLSSEQYADRFGVSSADMAKVVAWLQSQNFIIKYAATSRTFVFFAGTAENVVRTFQTEIHYYKAGSETHYAADREPAIPAALVGTVFGLRGTDNFYPRSSSYFPTLNAPYNFGLLPVDLRALYNIPSTASYGAGGAGVSVAVVGQATLTATDINGDISRYYDTYSVPSAGPGFPRVGLLPGPSPGTGTTLDFQEAYLDIDMVLAVAPLAAVQYVYSANVYNAVAYAIDQNVAGVISMSFGGCEPDAAGTTTIPGDPAGCVFPGDVVGHGLSVNLPASIPEVTGVGGTEVSFIGNLGTQSPCLDIANDSFSCYPGEYAWNTITTVPPGPIGGSGGGISSFFPAPAWQIGLPGLAFASNSNYSPRGVPDVAFAASAAFFPYMILWNGQLTAIGGTSAATPVFAGIVALLNQHELAIGQQERLGNINPALYGMAQVTPKVFHDVTAGNNDYLYDCSNPAFCITIGPAYTGYLAAPGYDLVTGLGSVDATALVTNWLTAVAKAPQAITFSVEQNPIFGAGYVAIAGVKSGLEIAFTSNSTSVCTAPGVASPALTNGAGTPGLIQYWYVLVNVVAAGTCSITASQPGNANYAAATPVTQTLAVNTGLTAQTIAFGPLSNQVLGSAPPQLSATASSGLAVGFGTVSTSVCTVSGVNVTLVAAGTCSITASQAGNSIYAAAIPVTQPFTVFSATTTGPQALQLITVSPCRIMDTRNANGPLGGPFIGGGATRIVPIPSSTCGIPASASAYSLNFTVVPKTGTLSYLSVWPAGQAQPFVSTLNSLDGSTIANAAVVPAGTAGAIEAFATNNTDLIIDINGYFVPPAANSLQFYPLTPCRVLDTRNPTGTFGGPSIAGGSSRSFPIPSSSCGVPAGAAAYALNVTVVPHGALEYLTAWPTGQAQPGVSTLNSFNGTILANAAIVPAGTNGSASFYASNTTDLVVDINGYFAPPGFAGLNFYALTPCRLVDTRNANGAFGGPTMGANTTRAFPLSQASCGLPVLPGAQAYSLNMTVIPQGVLSYLSTWPAGGAQPAVSTLNAFKGQIVANAAIVPAGGAGAISVYVTNTTDVVIDTNGYFGP